MHFNSLDDDFFPEMLSHLFMSIMEVDAETVGRVSRWDPQVAAIYRVGSRADGTFRPDSDYDYLVLLDQNVHYGRANTLGYRRSEGQWIEEVTFTRKDLGDPENMEGKEAKLLFLYGRNRRRVLLYGKDLFDEWLSPEIEAVFEANGINEETVAAWKARMKSSDAS